MITPAGHPLGGKRDTPDARDHSYRSAVQSLLPMAIPPRIDLRPYLPPAFEQGDMQSCGGCCGAALMAHQFPECATLGFSRLQIYTDARLHYEGTLSFDAGVQTRNVMKVLTRTGAAYETQWPYDRSRLFIPPPLFKPQHRLKSYSRLLDASDFMTCLAEGVPFILGFQTFESIDSAQLATTGVMPMPDIYSEMDYGGHDVLVVGHDLHFKQSDDFKRTQLDPALVGDEALLCRNSWGREWGIGGHFWMPMSYATDASVGGDAWTGRR